MTVRGCGLSSAASARSRGVRRAVSLEAMSNQFALETSVCPDSIAFHPGYALRLLFERKGRDEGMT
jgi:hypothetical protein